MNKFNRSRSYGQGARVSYKVGDLAMYNYDVSGSESCDLLVIVLEKTIHGQYLIRFLDDGSDMTCVHSELTPMELS